MIECQHCQAMKFRDESKGMCCSNGKINPEPFPPLPQQLAILFKGTKDQSVRFLQDARKYNSAFQLTSLGCKEVRMNGWNPKFRIQGLPQHILSLKVGMPVMLLRFIKPPELMNGTRCIIRSCNRNTVGLEITAGAHKGEIHLVPRIQLQPSDTTFLFKFQRRQLPLKGCFAMTINKAQGQTLHSIGLDLQQPVFSHGMLYVVLSRSGKRDNIAYLCSP
ncbi:hypothetical protein RRG08_030229 [Elysia crispata]|uniref:DNA helicase Pif1-like 2B domain-containing protein n=1 Tax=Elysia crispata TaxID=231223 RepID=A0AAE1AJ02_9GAST|nr:hypothetical protein RRG08_030229 [Elysia crispata]